MSEIYSDNRITLLHNGDAYFPVLEEALDRAEHGIFLETYIFENDHTHGALPKPSGEPPCVG